MKKSKTKFGHGMYRAQRKFMRYLNDRKSSLSKNNWRKLHGYPKLRRVHLGLCGESNILRKDYEELIKKGIYTV